MPQYPGICAYFNFFALLRRQQSMRIHRLQPDALRRRLSSGPRLIRPVGGWRNATSFVPYFFPSSPADRQFGSGFSPYQIF